MCFYSFDRDCPLNVVNISITGMNTLVSVSGQSSEQPIASVSWQGTHQGYKVLSSLAVSFKKKNRLYSLEKFQVHSKLRGRCRHFPSRSCPYTCVCSPSINNSDPCAPQHSASLVATDKPTLKNTSVSPKVRSLHQGLCLVLCSLWLWTNYNDIYPTLQYHTEYYHCPKNPQYSTYEFLPPLKFCLSLIFLLSPIVCLFQKVIYSHYD